MKTIFDQHIGIFEDAVPREFCESIINIFENNKKLSVGRNKGDYKSYLHSDDLMLGLHLIDEGKHENLCKTLASNFWENMFPLYTKKYKFKDLLPSSLVFNDFKIQKTSPTEGYHVWHIEHHPYEETAKNRIMVYTLYLNDVTEGGETEFLIQSKRVNPKQGTLCIFPAGFTHIHRGNPPLSGNKYIMTGWIEFVPQNQKPNE